MAVFAITDGSVVINSVDLSDHVRSFELNLDSDSQDTTTMGDTWRDEIGGVKSAGLNIEFLNDHAASSVDATLWAALGTVVTFTVKPTSAATSATNPAYSGSVHVNSHTVGGSHGEVTTVQVTFPTAGTVSRATS